MILDTIVKATKDRVAKAKELQPLDQLIRTIGDIDKESLSFPFEDAIRKKDFAFICEVKKASPSKGVISEDFPFLQIAEEYEEGGAAAISVLTEPSYFLGDEMYLTDIKRRSKVPILRKDFIIDAYQIYESKVIGADAILLICALYDLDGLKAQMDLAHSLGLSVLVEAHTKDEIHMALASGARIIGVNNRNLQSFVVDIDTCIRLRQYVPEEILYIAESGIATREDIMSLKIAGIDGVLIGETLMRSEKRIELLQQLQKG